MLGHKQLDIFGRPWISCLSPDSTKKIRSFHSTATWKKHPAAAPLDQVHIPHQNAILISLPNCFARLAFPRIRSRDDSEGIFVASRPEIYDWMIFGILPTQSIPFKKWNTITQNCQKKTLAIHLPQKIG